MALERYDKQLQLQNEMYDTQGLEIDNLVYDEKVVDDMALVCDRLVQVDDMAQVYDMMAQVDDMVLVYDMMVLVDDTVQVQVCDMKGQVDGMVVAQVYDMMEPEDDKLVLVCGRMELEDGIQVFCGVLYKDLLYHRLEYGVDLHKAFGNMGCIRDQNSTWNESFLYI